MPPAPKVGTIHSGLLALGVPGPVPLGSPPTLADTRVCFSPTTITTSTSFMMSSSSGWRSCQNPATSPSCRAAPSSTASILKRVPSLPGALLPSPLPPPTSLSVMSLMTPPCWQVAGSLRPEDQSHNEEDSGCQGPSSLPPVSLSLWPWSWSRLRRMWTSKHSSCLAQRTHRFQSLPTNWLLAYSPPCRGNGRHASGSVGHHT